MKELFSIGGFHITIDPAFQNERYSITPELENQFETLYFECQEKNNNEIIDKLNNLIEKYPKVPQLKNYLSIAYNEKGKYHKSVEVNNRILTEHPDYLFAKLNEAHDYLNSDKPEKVPGVLGKAMELKQLYPDRDIFHLAEVTGFYKTAVRYYTAIENIELAENRLDLMKEIAPDHPDTESAEDFVLDLRIKKGMNLFKDEEHQIIPDIGKPVPVTNITSAPIFNHPEINNLYHYGLRIPRELLVEIIALPRNTLIEDLEKLLTDSVERYQYFSGIEFDEDTHSFVLHALLLLNEVKSEESLPKIFSFIEFDEDFLDFWLGDHVNETIWQCFYGLCFNKLNTLKQLLLKPRVDTYVKASISMTLCQIVLHHPERRDEILNIYSDVFNAIINANIEDNLIDSDLSAFIIGDLIDCNLKELLPVIKQLYEKNYVNHDINGDYSEVEKLFREPSERNKKRDILSIIDLYDEILNTWGGYIDEMDPIEDDELYDYDEDNFKDFYTHGNFENEPEKFQQAVSNKFGRNEPCPCGSGKKYKKCCIGK